MHDIESKLAQEVECRDLAALCERSLKLALSIPTDLAFAGSLDARDADFLVAARRLSIDLSQAVRWSSAELSGHADALALATAALALCSTEGVAAKSNSGAGGGGGSCVDEGVRGFNACLDGCNFPGGGGASIGCAMRCRQEALEAIVGCLLRKIGSVFA